MFFAFLAPVDKLLLCHAATEAWKVSAKLHYLHIAMKFCGFFAIVILLWACGTAKVACNFRYSAVVYYINNEYNCTWMSALKKIFLYPWIPKSFDMPNINILLIKGSNLATCLLQLTQQLFIEEHSESVGTMDANIEVFNYDKNEESVVKLHSTRVVSTSRKTMMSTGGKHAITGRVTLALDLLRFMHSLENVEHCDISEKNGGDRL